MMGSEPTKKGNSYLDEEASEKTYSLKILKSFPKTKMLLDCFV